VNGIGERAGNTSLEEVVVALRIRQDYFGQTTTVKTERLLDLSQLVSEHTGMIVQRNKAVVGANAYAHSSGIHQDGVLKERSTYEIIDPHLVGAARSEIILTARSGRHGLKHRLLQLGYDFPTDRFDEIYDKFLEVADKKTEVRDEDLQELVKA
jgi:2-isopropylmalate synthase